jgi:hypothetical protein
MNQMAVIFMKQTNHVLAAVEQSAALPGLPSLVGSDGLHVAGVRGAFPPNVTGSNVAGYGVSTSQEERFVVPTTEIDMKLLPRVDDVFVRPHVYLVDFATVAALPPLGPHRDVSVSLDQRQVTIGSTDPTQTNSLTFPVDTGVFIQVEGQDPSDRRVMRGVLQANHRSPFTFQLTVEPGGPLAPIASNKRYFILVLIEGKTPDARTAQL